MSSEAAPACCPARWRPTKLAARISAGSPPIAAVAGHALHDDIPRNPPPTHPPLSRASSSAHLRTWLENINGGFEICMPLGTSISEVDGLRFQGADANMEDCLPRFVVLQGHCIYY